MDLCWFLVLALSSCVIYAEGQDTTGSVYRGCNHTIREGQGVILSPNFPNSYDADSNCQWQINVENDRSIFLTFKHFNIESSPNCGYDSLAIYNGPTASHPMLGKFCGPFKPSDLTTTSNRMLMRLKSDDSTQKSGFMAIFFSVAPGVATPNSCGGIMTGDEGNFHSVNFPKSPYPNSMTCTWHLRTAPGRTIRLSFTKLTLEESKDCRYDAVTVVGGWTNSDETRFLGRFCKITNVPSYIESMGNEMFVIFTTDSSGNDDGFWAQYTTISGDQMTITSPPGKTKVEVEPASSVCRYTTVLTADHASFSSPGYKETAQYQSNLRCSWRILTPRNTRIVLTFTNFALEEHEGCIFDYVAVYAGRKGLGTPMARYCGSMVNTVLDSQTNELFIVFVTDSGGSAAGFRAEYQIEYLTTTELQTTTTALPITTSRSTSALTTTSLPSTTTEAVTSVTTLASTQSSGCPIDCISKDMAEAACTSSHVILFKVLKVKESRRDQSARIFVALLKAFKKGSLTAGKRRGTRFWLDVPCTSCLPPLARRSKYILAGDGQGAVVTHTDFMENFRKKLVPFMKKAIRRCRRAKRGKRRSRKRGKKRSTKKKQ